MSTSKTKTPPSVALIGCGPSGMFFLHALAIRRAKLEEEEDAIGLAALPIVTCFERSSGPGGVWRSDRFKGGVDNGDVSNASTNMYEALWTNGPKESMEFFDHTYLEHFGHAMPTFLPREHVLEYLLARCTKNNPNFFASVKFNTSVDSVSYDEDTEKFIVDLSSNKSETQSSFDVCVWAAGLNGKPKVPPFIRNVLTEGRFKGVTMHSSQTDSNFDKHVRAKNILIIGDAYSAEDLTLSAIKLEVKSVEIVTRSACGIASDTTAWPMGKVNVNNEYVPTGVTEDGYGIVLSCVEYDYEKGKYKIGETEQRTLVEIDTVIFCTGYEGNFDMLDERLRLDMSSDYSKDYVPSDWKMTENLLSEELGDVPLGNLSALPRLTVCAPREMYRGRLMSVPSMYYMLEYSESPLLNLDIAAWRALAQITGDLPLPSLGEMQRLNMETMLDIMNDPYIRYLTDSNYKKKWDETTGDQHWTSDRFDHRSRALDIDCAALDFRLLARDALDSGYPVDIGTYEHLSDKGEALLLGNIVTDYARYKMEYILQDDPLRTFRDCDPSECVSIFTGTRAVPLKYNWLELTSCKLVDIVDETAGEGKYSVEAAQVKEAANIVDQTDEKGKGPGESSPVVIPKTPNKDLRIVEKEDTMSKAQEEKRDDVELCEMIDIVDETAGEGKCLVEAVQVTEAVDIIDQTDEKGKGPGGSSPVVISKIPNKDLLIVEKDDTMSKAQDERRDDVELARGGSP